MKGLRYLYIFLLLGIFSCSTPKPSEIDKESYLIKERAKNDSITQANEEYFKILLRENKEKILFLDFWEGMTVWQYQYSESRMLKNGSLSQDFLPEGVSRADWNMQYGCGKKIERPYIKLQVGDYEEKGLITKEVDDSTKLVNSVGFFIVDNYKPYPEQNSCTIASYTRDNLIKLFIDKYGNPGIENYMRGIYNGKVYIWNVKNKIIEVSYETYFNNEADYMGNPIIVDLWVNYIFKNKKIELRGREKLIERQERERQIKILNETKEKI